MGYLAAFCFMLLGRKWGVYLSLPLILLFVPVAGATPSVIRAAVMYGITALGFILRRDVNPKLSLMAALALLLLLNPYAAAGAGLQLSFSATLGLILFASSMQHRLARAVRGMCASDAAAACLSGRGALVHGLRLNLHAAGLARLFRTRVSAFSACKSSGQPHSRVCALSSVICCAQFRRFARQSCRFSPFRCG